MESVIFKDFMACLTLVQRGELEADTVNFASEKCRIWLHEKLESVEDPIHPGDVFKMVAGTSTGALMAFGLLHGEISYALYSKCILIRNLVKNITNGEMSQDITPFHFVFYFNFDH